MEEFLNIEIEIVEVLLIVTLVAMVARRIKLPYTVALVLAGLLIALQNELRIELTPELVLALFLPPLVFEAAFHLRLGQLRANLTPILTLAIPGVLLSTALVGILLSLFGILPLPAALLFGALIAATDPVAVIAVFRAVGAPKQLTVLVEGESLFNDGTAIVVFHIMLAYVLEGTLSPLEGVVDFFIVSLGGVAIGLILGYGTAELIARIDDYLIEITLTTVAAYGSYLIAESFHMSGVLAVVMAGLVIGNVGPRGMSPTTRIVLINFWEYLAFLANSFVFILIGMNVEYDELLQFAGSALVA
ncbi:MAG: cation:proton antiporter, partial [Caldilineaceae bacterium]|nr:cation:proton antiporter [Caldilineaceae bacterium]